MKKQLKYNSLKRFRGFLKEILVVIFGVLIAFLINNWNENRKEKKYLNQVFSSIHKDLTETNNNFKESIPQNETVADSLNFYMENDSVSILDIFEKVNGISGKHVKLNFWKTLETSKIGLIEYEKITTLSTIEEDEKFLNKKIEILTNFIYPNINETSREKKATVLVILYDMINIEKELQKEIESYLIKYND